MMHSLTFWLANILFFANLATIGVVCIRSKRPGGGLTLLYITLVSYATGLIYGMEYVK